MGMSRTTALATSRRTRLNLLMRPSICCFRLGLLDMAGFESFEHNSFEQLFINLGNEYLQQHFKQPIFKMDLDSYKAEGCHIANDLNVKDHSDINLNTTIASGRIYLALASVTLL